MYDHRVPRVSRYTLFMSSKTRLLVPVVLACSGALLLGACSPSESDSAFGSSGSASGGAKVLYLALPDVLIIVPWDSLPTEAG